MEEELNALYDALQADFSTFYKTINEDDEVKFTAKLTPSAGKLDFDVNFYERGCVSAWGLDADRRRGHRSHINKIKTLDLRVQRLRGQS
jgi:hypothetical protein